MVGEADGSGEGDCPAVEKFEPLGLLLGNGLLIGTGSWGRLVVTLAGAAAAFVPARAFVPICVVPPELPIELPNPPAAAPLIIPPV